MTLSVSAYKITIIDITPATLIAATTLTQADFDEAAYFEVHSDELADIRVDMDTDCVFSTYKRVHFLTQFGSIESMSFGLLSRKSGTIESFGYRKTFGEWSGSSFIWTKEQGRDIDYAKSIDRKMVCVSDWLSEALQNWIIYNLYGSPLVYEESGALLIRRKCTNKTIDEKIQENDMLFLEQLTLMLPTHNSMVI